MKQLDRSSIESRIVEILMEVYPITVEDLSKELKLKKSVVMRGLRNLEREGIVRLEPLSDKTFIRLERRDISFIGRRATQQKALKRKSGNRNKRTPDENIGYG